MNLIFYNHYGSGDLFESREFALDWMKIVGVEKAYYACRKCFHALFSDLPSITPIEVTEDMDMRAAVTRRGGDIFVNTWIGARNAQTKPPGDYVLWPGVGCTVDNLYRMHNDYLKEAGLVKLPRPIVGYIPSINYSQAVRDRITKWIKDKPYRLILMCNGPTGSNHASNFDFGPILDWIPQNPDRAFIFSEKGAHIPERDDVFWTDDITGRNPGECDLLAVSFLSRFCEIIVGRCSGAQMHTQVIQNWVDPSKTQVCFTKHRNGAAFVLDPEALGLHMKIKWSAADNAKDASDVIKGVM